MKKMWTFLESFKRKLKLLKSPERKPAGNLRRKWKKKNQKNLRETKLIKFKNRKKKIWNSEKLERNLKKLRGIWRTGTQFKANFGTVFKNNEILRKILQN